MQTRYENHSEVGGNGQENLSRKKNGNKSQPSRPKVAVLGSGIGGLWAAKTLANGPVEVMLIDRHNYHTFFIVDERDGFRVLIRKE